MLQYPSIPSWKKARMGLGLPCYAFYKYDGSNLRWEWNRKKGWHKYGTRTQLFDANTPLYNQAIPLFMEDISPVTKDTMSNLVLAGVKEHLGRLPERITAFTEFFGESSFAGTHDLNEEKMLILLDVFMFKKGFIPPADFSKIFWHHHCAEVVYKGIMNKEFIQKIRDDIFPCGIRPTGVVIWEGVVCKGNGWNVKIKTDAYLERLKNFSPAAFQKEMQEIG